MQTDAMPNPAFVDGLEVQLRRELRRAERFAPASGRGSRRWAGVVALVLASGLLGAAGLGAAQQAQAARRAEPVVRAMEARDKAAAQVRASAAAALADTRALYQAGESPADRVTRADARLAAAEALTARAALDLEEARLSDQPPRDELSAPKVKGRDFVSERLRAVLGARARLLTLAGTALEQALSLHRLGESGIAAVAAAQLGAELAEIDVREASARIGARERFLAGKAAAAATERSDLRTLADHRVLRAEARTKAARARLDTAKQMHAAGSAGSGEVRQAEDALAEADWELASARSEAGLLG